MKCVAVHIVVFGILTCAAGSAQVRKSVLPPQSRRAPLPQGPELVQRLAAMSPEDRETALSLLPPARRANLEERIRAFQALPPRQQKAMRERAERISSLPPEKQMEVRTALRDFNQLPQDRKVVLRREVRRTTGMPDDSREAYMNSEGFRNRFSPEERKMIDVLREIEPDEPAPPAASQPTGPNKPPGQIPQP